MRHAYGRMHTYTALPPHTQAHKRVYISFPHELLWTPSRRRPQVALLVLAVAAVVSNAQEYSTEEVIRNLQTTADAEELVDCVLGTRQPRLPCRQMFLDFRREFIALSSG